jgi:SsrA-binding protein
MAASKPTKPTSAGTPPKKKGAQAGPKGKSVEGDRVVIRNRKARHEFDILDTVEAGIMLKGSEVKVLRDGKGQVADAFARIEHGEVWLHGLHIPPYHMTTSAAFGHDPDRGRKLLLHRNEIERLRQRLDLERLTLVPLSIYFTGGRAKVELALARGRKLHDRREAIARRDADREAAKAIAAPRRRN